MPMPGIQENTNNILKPYQGLIQWAFVTGSPENVDERTSRLKSDSYRVIGKPRRTGDGYYESIILDPEGSRIETVA